DEDILPEPALLGMPGPLPLAVATARLLCGRYFAHFLQAFPPQLTAAFRIFWVYATPNRVPGDTENSGNFVPAKPGLTKPGGFVCVPCDCHAASECWPRGRYSRPHTLRSKDE